MRGTRAVVRELSAATPGKARRRVIEALVIDLATAMTVGHLEEPPRRRRPSERTLRVGAAS